MKLNSLLLLNFFLIQFTFAQNDLNNSIGPNKIKIDGVAAVVGDYVILESDVDKTLIDLQSQGCRCTQPNLEQSSALANCDLHLVCIET